MTAFTDGAAELEQKADKWFTRLKKDTQTVLLLLLISAIIWLSIQNYQSNKSNREDLAKKDGIIAQKDGMIVSKDMEIARLNRELKEAYADATKANGQTIQLLMFGKLKTQDSAGR